MSIFFLIMGKTQIYYLCMTNIKGRTVQMILSTSYAIIVSGAYTPSIVIVNKWIIGNHDVQTKKHVSIVLTTHQFEKVWFRIRRMNRILSIENFLMETKSSNTGYWDITKFLKSNAVDASECVLKLRNRCKQYISHHL